MRTPRMSYRVRTEGKSMRAICAISAESGIRGKKIRTSALF